MIIGSGPSNGGGDGRIWDQHCASRAQLTSRKEPATLHPEIDDDPWESQLVRASLLNHRFVFLGQQVEPVFSRHRSPRPT